MKTRLHFHHNLNNDQLLDFTGPYRAYFSFLEDQYAAQIDLMDDEVVLEAEEASAAKLKDILENWSLLIRQKEEVSLGRLKQLALLGQKPLTEPKAITYMVNGKKVFPKTKGQQALIDLFKSKDLVFAVGPAGTGKTFLAVAYAVACLRENRVQKIILTRPAVEAGENLGFLPGDLKEKVDPYLQPIYDSLNQLLGAEATDRLVEKKVIEIAPLAYMRGRSLNDALVILDEAQNTTRLQMKMFLTRLGFNSRMIITGDMTQIDLPFKKNSGLGEALDRLKDLEEVGQIYLSSRDIVRHPLVSKILACYDDDLNE